MITWVLVAQRAGSQIYQHRGPGKGLDLHATFENEEGRLRDREIDSDRPGRAFDSHRIGRHAMEAHEAPHERIAATFARTMAQTLDESRMKGDFDQLILVAEPRMLGLLRKALGAGTTARVRGSIDKEYLPSDRARLERELGQLLAV